jgi:chromosome segregation protein
MRIRRVELNGFKSFMEPTALELPPGITAIVGPNGCGKSNIVDAIRWVLGEQSPKHLRGAAMEDVVFGGNADSGPLGMAEVSLLLERSEDDLTGAQALDDDGLAGTGLPPQLANASEIMVSRRYFRSGESEYFINNTPCRLKDITELFLGTGVGAKAYAIIEQGRVDQLVNAKPEDLRLFLEEAAGTTRFRSRKQAAERKMERTRENLVRVQDVLRELERQRASLERQAKRAEDYRRLKGELRDLDLRVMAGQHRRWNTELQDLTRRLVMLEDDEVALHAEIDRCRGATSDARATRTADEAALRQTDGEITAQRLAAAAAQARAAGLLVRRQDLAGRAADLEAEAHRLTGRWQTLAAEATALEAQAADLEGELPRTEASRAAADVEAQRLTIAGAPLEEAVEVAKDALVEALAAEARLQNVNDALRRRRGELEGRQQRLADEQKSLGERLRANARDRDAAQAAVTRSGQEEVRLGAECQAFEVTLQALRVEEGAQVTTLEQARSELTQLRSRAESLRELHARYEGCARGAASVLTRQAGTAALLASVLRVPAELERAVATALGSRLTQVVVPDTMSALGAIRWLQETAGGSATVLPREAERRAPTIVPPGRRLVDMIEVDPQHWALVESLLGHVLLADDLDAALAVWRAATHPVTVVTASGVAIDSLGAVTGGSEPPLEEIVLARARELRDLEKSLQAAAARLATEEETHAAIGRRRDDTTRARAAAQDRLQALRLELVAQEKDRERLEAERDRISAELEVLALEAGAVASEDGEIAGELATVEERCRSAADTVEGHRGTLTDRQAAVARWRQQWAEIERTRTAAAVAAAAVAERLQAARSQLVRYRAEIADLEERVARVQEQASASAAAAATAEQEVRAAEEEGAKAVEQATRLENERAKLLVAIARVDTVMLADETAERTAVGRLEALREERARVDVALAERRVELEHLAAQLAERYGDDVTVLTALPVEDASDHEQSRLRVEEIRGRLARMGEVNPAAIEELEELCGRESFLVTQRTDLERSLDDLRRTIAKLARTSRERFEETFRAANDRLAEVFPRLFPGGRARLERIALEDGHEPGVEIVVQPAGKKLQSLTLLSGGEKALTAVALILSLFLIRPTPFCLLDEVDAPLDEANIGRFNQLVRELAKGSQFVVITHNRRTMEAADTLYGITMERAGVSKVVSVRLREAA